jgi:HprK-related kinase A
MIANTPLIGQLSPSEFSHRLTGKGLGLRMGPFDVLIRARARALAGVLQSLYAHYPVTEGDHARSFHVRLDDHTQWLPRPRRVVRFMVDGRAPHEDMPAYQALPVLEWGINLVVALRYHCFLMLHAGVVEKNGLALVLPAEPGSGKTTLSAALASRGWRLLSDEFGLLRPGTTDFIPLPRLMPVKNEAIDVLTRFAPQAHWGPVIENTRKGTIRHLRPSSTCIERAQQAARARWVVFPRWQRNAALNLQPVTRTDGFMQVATNAFNYEMLGHAGFATVRSLIESVSCYRLEYGDLEEAVAALNRLAEEDAR